MKFPSSRRDQISYLQARAGAWTSAATTIGLTAAQMVILNELIETAAAKLLAMDEAHVASKNATQQWYIACDAMAAPARDYIRTIKAYAATTNNPEVLTIAGIDPPAPPSPATEPDVPSDVVGTVSPTGIVTVSWKATRSGPSTGIIFMVQRKRQGEAGWSIIGATQEKAFIDPSANVAAGNVSYQVRAQRGALASNWTTPITFDIDNSGNFTSVVGEIGGASAQAA